MRSPFTNLTLDERRVISQMLQAKAPKTKTAHTLNPSDVYQPDRAAIASKAAIGMWALWETPYPDLLLDAVADLSTDDSGFHKR